MLYWDVVRIPVIAGRERGRRWRAYVSSNLRKEKCGIPLDAGAVHVDARGKSGRRGQSRTNRAVRGAVRERVVGHPEADGSNSIAGARGCA
jgi:hypothetical protein